MSKKELILVHPTALINDLFPKEGFATGPDMAPNFANIQQLETALNEGLAIKRREAVEENPDYRHLLPYVQIFRVNPEGELEVFVYQRVKGSGEERLLGRHSIGLGGHINVSHAQFYDAHSSLNLGMTIMYNVMEELCEELTLNDQPIIQALLDENIRAQPSIYGYLNDNSDPVGQRHLGVTMLMMIPHGLEPVMGESSAVGLGFIALSKLRENLGDYQFENWSKLLIEGFDDSFIDDLTQAGIAAATQLEAFKAQQAEALKGLVAVGGVEGALASVEEQATSTIALNEGFAIDTVDNRVIPEV